MDKQARIWKADKVNRCKQVKRCMVAAFRIIHPKCPAGVIWQKLNAMPSMKRSRAMWRDCRWSKVK